MMKVFGKKTQEVKYRVPQVLLSAKHYRSLSQLVGIQHSRKTA